MLHWTAAPPVDGPLCTQVVLRVFDCHLEVAASLIEFFVTPFVTKSSAQVGVQPDPDPRPEVNTRVFRCHS